MLVVVIALAGWKIYEALEAVWDSAPALASAPEPVGPRPNLAGFEPGNLISDERFYDAGAMGESEIKAFIEKVGAGCRPGPDGSACLSQYREDTPSFPASAYCAGYTGQAGESAARIIAKTAAACGINPQVILVILQKEQGLLTASSATLTARRYETAMGYGCPDGGQCDGQYFGFATQVYAAASQFQRYRLEGAKYKFQAGTTREVAYHPQAACGSAPVTFANQATAGLYNYTPYQPNAAALSGYDDGCASWGNANFYGLFQTWFGNPRQ